MKKTQWLAGFALAAFSALAMASEALHLSQHENKVLPLPDNIASFTVSDTSVVEVIVTPEFTLQYSARNAGSSTFIAYDDEGEIVLQQEVFVGLNVKPLNAMLRSVFPDSDLVAKPYNNTLILEGSVKNPEQAEKVMQLVTPYVPEDTNLINFMKVEAAPQINLQVKVVDMSRDVNRNIGIDWSTLFSRGDSELRIGSVNSGFSGSQNINGQSNANLTRNQAIANFTLGRFNFESMIDFLESDGLASVISQPNLTAMSGETANFLAGGEFPIIVADGNVNNNNNNNNNGVNSVAFKEFGIRLNFTPTLIDDKRIQLKVSPEVSTLSSAGAVQYNGISVPSLSTRRADTTIELNSGESFAIAGLLDTNTRHDTNNLPGFKKLPFIGRVFNAENYARSEKELLIIVTAHVVKPTKARKLQLNGQTQTLPGETQAKQVDPEYVGFLLG